jgi:methionyl-tRNA formyltransferase
MKLIFMGTPESAVPTLRRCVEEGHEVLCVWTQPDRPAGRGNKLKAPPVKEFALSQGLAVHQPSKIKTEEALALFTEHEFDAAVVVAYGRILPPTFLRAPRLGCINESGVTTMLMDEGLDTGPILLQRSTAIEDGETAPHLLERLSHVGAELLVETLSRLDEIESRPQDDTQATQAPILRREDGLIDWSLNASEIEHRVRGFQPWPNAFTTHHGRRLIVWRAAAGVRKSGLDDAVPLEDATVAAGTLVVARGDDLVVACGGETVLKLLEVQPEGKQRLRARDFINGSHAQAGEPLG